ncbi:hypothetical protein [Mycolicibacterium hodleri]|uniref:DUF2867 domain-containing protein n=1 Tax=Mycolicibacterium hodleri TaxID=49897 RepID=A0A502EB30_9MYCO|nr:hypothetical protein [Mycolicibacterium hodleri]TPG33641.1 hypothetical protein EAH80_15365 [Mycolicibacterium hodleri]
MPDLRHLSTLPRVDYVDAFVIGGVAALDWTAERWAREILEGAPADRRAALLAGWRALGLKSEGSAGSILGWEVRRRNPDALLIGRESLIGMPGELLFTRRPEGLLFATFVHHHAAVTRPVWAAVQPMHVRTVGNLLQRAGRAASDVRESAEAD